ncbi:MAG: N-acetylneuraminate synthase family protein [Candidatus Omnitrophica bacterium]|nr:N-acetylneuraminate synthase family protein [Candidatus Omnitrophota bacterium]
MKIANFNLDEDILIVAEIGNNHEGSLRLAERLIGLAAQSGADAVKFQTIVPSRLVSSKQKERLRQLEKFRLSYKEFEKLSKVAKHEGVLFLSTPLDIESARFLNKLVPAFKIASADNNFFPLIETIAKTGKPIILSSGLATIDEIEAAANFIERVWRRNGVRQELAVLHCVTSYPVRPDEANLLAIKTLRERLKMTIGYSDHTIGIDAAVLSVALGARIIEKHFTIDKNYSDFRDHKLSADPHDFKKLVKKIRGASKMLGDGIKRPQKSETDIARTLRRSIVARRDLKKGKMLGDHEIAWARAEAGLSIGQESQLMGRFLSRAVKRGEPILPCDTYGKSKR